MAIALGKRKRTAPVARPNPPARSTNESDDDSQDEAAARALFQRAFEAKFKALETKPIGNGRAEPIEESEEEDESEESDWDGIEESEGEEVQVVDYAQLDAKPKEDGGIVMPDRKAFMSSRPPRSDSAPTKASATAKTGKAAGGGDDEDGTEIANLKNDLALQRLLKESHLLDPAAAQRASFSVEAKGRLKALDMRLQDLGAKTSIMRQERMPMAQRKGIASKRTQKETVRRKEAAENGIILERFSGAGGGSGGSKAPVKRQRGIGGPSVGKFQRGMLKLSSRDVKDIVGDPKGKPRSRKGKIKF